MIHALLLAAVLFGAGGLLLALATLAVTPRLSKAASPGVPTPRVSIVIPARDEEREIASAVSSQLSQDYPDFEVIVVDDRSTDRTGEILASLASRDPRLRVIESTNPPPGWLGKPNALASGAREADGGLLLFADADVRYDPRALREAVSVMTQRRADLVAFLPRMEAEGFWENVLMPYLIMAFFSGAGLLASLDRPRWLALGGGAGMLVSRKAYEAVGGHDALKDSVVDDVRLAITVKRAGFRAIGLRAEDRVRVRMYRGLREVWNGFSKNMAYAFQGVFAAPMLLLTAFGVLAAVVPPLVLLASALGLPVPSRDVGLAAAAALLTLLSRVAPAAALGDPLWPCLAHPIMTAVWAGIICRSFYFRIVQRRLVWRGRVFDARAARF